MWGEAGEGAGRGRGNQQSRHNVAERARLPSARDQGSSLAAHSHSGANLRHTHLAKAAVASTKLAGESAVVIDGRYFDSAAGPSIRGLEGGCSTR